MSVSPWSVAGVQVTRSGERDLGVACLVCTKHSGMGSLCITGTIEKYKRVCFSVSHGNL